MRIGRRHDRGQSMVETALILPIFILVLVGIFDTGRLVFAYHTVNNAAREGGRQATVDQTATHIQERAAQHAVALGVDPADVVVDYRDPATPESANSCLTEDGLSALGTDEIYGCLAVVRVPYAYTAATPVVGNIIGPMTVTGEVRFPVEFSCMEPDTPQCPVGE
ncbi:MAG: TadE/TadG family type IV pilus assembly protein [Candidatus Limnocylindria bacterium]